MKTFEQIADKCFKPNSVHLVNDLEFEYRRKTWTRRDGKILRSVASNYINKKYNYSKRLMRGDFYGADINEPVVKICKRILNKPARFQLVIDKNGTSEDYNNGVWTKRVYTYGFILQDRDTNQQFIVEYNTLKFPTCLTDDENRLLVAVLNEWYINRGTLEKDKKLKREQKRKDKFRQELTDLYKDL